jgi:PKD domain
VPEMTLRRPSFRGFVTPCAIAVVCPLVIGVAVASSQPETPAVPAPVDVPPVAPQPARPVVAFAPIPSGNETANPSFDASLRGWASWQGALSRVAAPDAPDGGFVARVDYRSGAAFTVDDIPDSVAPSTVGTTYIARAFVRAAEASSVGKRARLTLREWSDSSLARVTSGSAVRLTSTFQPMVVTITATVPGSTIDVHATQLGAAAGDAFLIDQISVVGNRPSGSTGNRPPRAAFTVSPPNAAPGQEIVLTSTSTDADGVIVSTFWDLNGDGVFDDATGPEVSRSFAEPGSYAVAVRVIDDDGARSAARRVIAVAPAVVEEALPAG